MILAIDPGSKECGWALLSQHGSRVAHVMHGQCPSTPRGIRSLINHLPEGAEVTILALEVVEGYVHEAFRAKHLFPTAEAVGMFEMIGHEMGITVVRMTARDVRKLLVGKATHPKKGMMDILVEGVVKANVLRMPAQSNVHVRDALALGLAANWKLMTKGRTAA